MGPTFWRVLIDLGTLSYELHKPSNRLTSEYVVFFVAEGVKRLASVVTMNEVLYQNGSSYCFVINSSEDGASFRHVCGFWVRVSLLLPSHRLRMEGGLLRT